MPKSGQARVLNLDQIRRVISEIKKRRHSKKNIAIIMISFRLGLRVQEISLLKIREVARLGPQKDKGRTFTILEIMPLPAAYTKGADALNRSKKKHVPKTISFPKHNFDQLVKTIEKLVAAGGTPNPEDYYPEIKKHKGKSRDLPMTDIDLREALTDYLKHRLDNDPAAKPSDPLFLSQKGTPYSPTSLAKHMALILKGWGEVERASSHSGRRTLLTNIIQRTKSLKVAQKVAGHASPATTLIYDEATEEQITDALNSAYENSTRH